MSSKKNLKRRSISRERTHENDKRFKRKHHDECKREKYGSSKSARRSFDVCESLHTRAQDFESENLSSESDGDTSKERNKDFQFSKYKHELNKIFMANANLVHDNTDFWKFVEKYESIKKQLGDNDEFTSDCAVNLIGVPEKYHKSHCLNFNLNLSFGELFSRVPEIKQLTKSRLLKFRDVILLYLDFKQKEKFNKLKKLRNMQANLPVSEYKEEIIKTIREEKVVIVAGDTGCGKSTQIPQYLYEAGFQKIGENLRNKCYFCLLCLTA